MCIYLCADLSDIFVDGKFRTEPFDDWKDVSVAFRVASLPGTQGLYRDCHLDCKAASKGSVS